MKFIKKNALGTYILLIGFLCMSHSSWGQSNWAAPKEADNIKNPLVKDTDATSKGKALFKNMCVVCHGNKGKGDGMAGMSLNPKPSNLTKEIIQNQSDGAIYWKITEGKPPMASYKHALTETQRWQLVNYIRELGSKK